MILMALAAAAIAAVPTSRHFMSALWNSPDFLLASPADKQVHYQPGAEEHAREAAALTSRGSGTATDASPPAYTLAFVYSAPTATSPTRTNHVYLTDLDAKGQSLGARRLTGFPEAENSPAWSPDGKSLLFVRNLDGAAIYRIEADGSHAQRLSPTPARDVFPVWSPNGKRIAYTRLLGNPPGPDDPPALPGTELRIMNADGSDDHAIYSSAFGVEPRWSGADKLVFMSRPSVTGKLNIYTINADGTGLRQLTHDNGNNGDPVWSPDGTRITFGSDREGGGRLNVYIMNADGSGQTPLTHFTPPAEVGDTHWSSDGKLIAFEYDVDGKKQSDPTAKAEIWLMPAGGGAPFPSQQPCSNVGCSPRFKPK